MNECTIGVDADSCEICCVVIGSREQCGGMRAHCVVWVVLGGGRRVIGYIVDRSAQSAWWTVAFYAMGFMGAPPPRGPPVKVAPHRQVTIPGARSVEASTRTASELLKAAEELGASSSQCRRRISCGAWRTTQRRRLVRWT